MPAAATSVATTMRAAGKPPFTPEIRRGGPLEGGTSAARETGLVISTAANNH